MVLEQLLRIHQSKDSKSKKGAKKAAVPEIPPLDKFLANNSWENAGDMFKNVSFVEDESKNTTLMGIRLTALKGIKFTERQTLFKDF